MSVLDSVRTHADLVALSDAQRVELCDDIRAFLISHVAQTGGHLASNLGVVELCVAIETVFDTRVDRLVFDVGHQSYVHKLLTGRREEFDHLRQFGGMAGFPKPSESDCDAFVAGHASSSVSIALGMAKARTLMGENYHVMALIGDGAVTGGLAYEGLNNAGVSKEPMIVILNDNAMSIDRNVGGIARHLSKLRTTGGYLGFKSGLKKILNRIPGGRHVFHLLQSSKNRIKHSILPTTLFELVGFTYLGPVDGHDVKDLVILLENAKKLNRPVLLHVATQKGRGYAPAEIAPSKYHGVGKFDPVTGEVLGQKRRSFSDAFGETLLAMAREDPRLCAITAAMPSGTGLLHFKNELPQRTFDVGIAEEHAVSTAGGLAKQGMIPVVAIYSTFLQRSYDMILQDIAMLRLHCVLAVDRAGLVGEDGETHHGVFDVGFLRQAPGMTILCPASTAELENMLHWAVEAQDGPVAIRYPRGGDRSYTASAWDPDCRVVCHRTGGDAALVTYGTLLENAEAAADLLTAQGIQVSVLRLTAVEPLPAEALAQVLGSCKKVFVLEETCTGSGIREALAWALHRLDAGFRVDGIDLGHRFVTHGDLSSLYRQAGLDPESVCKYVREALSHD